MNKIKVIQSYSNTKNLNDHIPYISLNHTNTTFNGYHLYICSHMYFISCK